MPAKPPGVLGDPDVPCEVAVVCGWWYALTMAERYWGPPVPTTSPMTLNSRCPGYRFTWRTQQGQAGSDVSQGAM